ncbi:mitochondrial and cytoplasmic alanine-tRNA ligase Ala1 [Neoconidiobolus thromboides FSU 785]|nr:mitochondrial and cytoplasmic alanine-tRNA ligase Ala1 [Neoconidiobolus thromboides FSU 785]
MTTWTSEKVRGAFFEYFEGQGHKFVPSSSTIPHDDPTLLFANAGMNQYKPIFLGTADSSTEFGKLKRAYNAQKCIRAGGKHNDLDDVGKDVYHHTFFEMLGNWSFGDYFKVFYFKKEAISMAWELLTKVYNLPSERLYVTYYGGDSAKGLEPDNESRDLWLSMGLSEDKVLPFGNKENFWEMGDQGPCGPCSEIHFDRIGGRDASSLVNLDDPDVLEIWNLVFIQFNREADGSLKPLPNKHVDTGMGLERLVSVLQEKRSNYDTDLFVPIFEKVQEMTGSRPYTGKVGKDDSDGVDMAYRVIADHVRTLLFSISDGGMPSNEGRGYVLRRILRRGCRYARRKFGVNLGSFFSSLLEVVIEKMGSSYPEITQKVQDVKDILIEEELSFARTLDRGERLFETCMENASKKGEKVISGSDAWRLYDTYGFPLDLTYIMAEERGFTVDSDQFNQEQAKAKELSRKGKGNKGDGASQNIILNVHDIAMVDSEPSITKSVDNFKYSDEVISSKVLGLFHSNELHQSVEQQDLPFGVLLEKTNFYAESGGQENDTGILSVTIEGEKAEFVVTNVQSYAGYILHSGYLAYGRLKVGQEVQCSYDVQRRQGLMRNHTGTHLLNFGLRRVLQSETIDQKGSLVAQDKLRFDFNCKSAVTPNQIKEIEQHCNDIILKDLKVHAQDVPLTEGRAIEGLRAVFGEVYPDPVRVVSVGPSIEEILREVSNPNWENYSIEFCGGTHVPSTKFIQELVIVEESAVSKGIRRIVALTGEQAKKAQSLANAFEKNLQVLEQSPLDGLDNLIKVVGKELDALPISCYRKYLFRERFAKSKKRFDDADKAAKANQVKEALEVIQSKIESTKDIPIVVEVLKAGSNAKALVGALNYAKNAKSHAVYVFSIDGDKVMHQCYVPDVLVKKGLKAVEWAGVVSELVGGKKGGKDESAQGAGTNPDKVPAAVLKATEYAFGLLKE